MTRPLARVAMAAACLGFAATQAQAGTAAGVAAGAYHACAVTAGGALVCWGRNTYGQLGDGTTTSRATPIGVSGLGGGIAAIAAGSNHSCALTAAGGVVCWGRNTYGQLGDGTTTDRWTATAAVGIGSSVTAVAPGVFHTCVLTASGDVMCW